MSSAKAEQVSRHRVIQTVVALYSFIFFGVIAYGYFFLSIKANIAIALVIAVAMPLLAWFLAKFIGSSEGGIRAHLPLFFLLLAISAAGVYNSAMLYWEGNRILADAASDSQDRFGALQALAEKSLTDSGVISHADKIRSLSESLFSEIRNPLNCGQGPRAAGYIAELQKELPGFEPLTSTGRRCERSEEVVDDYRGKIDNLIARAPWNNVELRGIVDQSQLARGELSRLHNEATTEYTPSMLRGSLATLENLNDRYRDLYARLGKQTDVDKLKPSLDLSAVQNLGDATKLLVLVWDRLDVATTYIYLLLAVSFDWLMIYLFAQARKNRVRRPVASSGLGGAW